MEIPYWLVLVILVGSLAVRHACSPVPTGRSKGAAVVLTAGASFAAMAWPAATIPASVLLTGVGVYLYLYRELTPLEPYHPVGPDRAESTGPPPANSSVSDR